MQDEVFIHNSRLTITSFYVEKLLIALAAGLALVICYHERIEDNLFWIFYALLGVALLFASDAIAMVIGRNGTRLTFHHLWRQSSFEITEARFLWISSKGNWLLRESPGVVLVAIGRHPWQLYFVHCDQKNNLSEMLDEYQTH